ncbi:hypothetical protein [Rhodopirellula sallentina]|uniref:hypothetical protein n=1 Tax=Rhodopirellula sallentina TaxID=1263869 RepID=UPI0003482B8E|nr:hypothetical protein [Rhodopirellula sallentina]
MSRYLEELSDDSHSTRERAFTGLEEVASNLPAAERQAIVQMILNRSLLADFETQLAIERLVEHIRWASYQQMLDRLMDERPSESESAFGEVSADESPLATTWNEFASRAGGGREAKRAFHQIASAAGPDLQWPVLNSRVRSNRVDLVLMSQLGCMAPQTPQLFRPQSGRTYEQMTRTCLAKNVSLGAGTSARVIGRLIDRTVLENPYGWSLTERLHVALLYDRFEAADSLREEVMRCEHPLARDLAAAILASCRRPGARTKATHSLIRDTDTARLLSALEDRRVVCMAPEQLVGRPGRQLGNQTNHRRANEPKLDAARDRLRQKEHKNENRKNEAARLPMEMPAIIRTRVQDVAAWALVQGTDFDVRRHGMVGLQADPVWGTRLASIGFASEPERATFLEAVKRHQSAGEY